MTDYLSQKDTQGFNGKHNGYEIKTKKKQQIFKIFHNNAVIINCPKYDLVFSEKEPYPSVFSCNHKYYQRTKERNPIPFTYIDIDDDEGNFHWKEIPPFPFFLKAPELQMSLHQYMITDCNQLKEIVEKLRISLPSYNADTKYVSQHYLDLQKYPLANKNIMICEEFMSNCLQLNWEGWADDQGNIFTYDFTDEIIFA